MTNNLRMAPPFTRLLEAGSYRAARSYATALSGSSTGLNFRHGAGRMAATAVDAVVLLLATGAYVFQAVDTLS
ncbi:MAG TPA: hypothetical protein VK896_12305 [Gaiellaceae bacterium]|nr:hypothetical protein [Gaiellaceae bacterium]